MTTVNHLIRDIRVFETWLQMMDDSFNATFNLVQLFDAMQDQERVRKIVKVIRKTIPNAHIVGMSTAGIHDNGVYADTSTLVSITSLESSSVTTLSLQETNAVDAAASLYEHLFIKNTKAVFIYVDCHYITSAGQQQLHCHETNQSGAKHNEFFS